MDEWLRNVYVTENKEKNLYMISFKSPLRKDKKGNFKQVNKSLGVKFRDKLDEVNKVAKDIKTIINEQRFYTTFDGYLEAKKKFHEKAVEIFFEKTEFENIYNDKIYLQVLDEKIKIKDDKGNYIEPTALSIGLPGSGKTTLEKQLIGATKTSFPATTQSNTTIGSLEILVQQKLRDVKGVFSLFSEAFIEERVEQNLIRVIRLALSNPDISHQEIYNKLTETEDRKFKFNFLLGENCENIAELISRIKSFSEISWRNYLDKNKDSDIKAKFIENVDHEVKADFEEFLEEQDEFDNIVSELISQLSSKYKEVILELITCITNQHNTLNHSEDFSYEICIANRSSKITIVNSEGIKDLISKIDSTYFPEYIYISFRYKSGRLPDKNLRNYFFKSLEFISSGDEGMRGKTLFPLVRGIRISGNFKPLWIRDDEPYKDFIIIDSEGFGHDIANREIPLSLRKVLLKCDRIFWVQDGSKPISEDNKELLKYLIVSGYINKTHFCINRLENFDISSNSSLLSKRKYIESGFDNLISALIKDEINEQDKIVTGKEEVYKNLINERMDLFEYLNKPIENREFVTSEKYDNILKMIENLKTIGAGQADIDLIELMLQQQKIYVNKDIKTVDNIDKLIKSLNIKAEPDWYPFKPAYRYDKFVHLSASISSNFREAFKTVLYESTWQAIKAFNNRIYYDYDGREWRELKPEAILDRLIKTKIYSFISNPENLSFIEEKERFIECVNFIAQDISDSIMEITKEIIVDDNIKEWELGVRESGSGSTSRRYNLILSIIDKKFYLNYEKGKYDNLYDFLRKIVVDNKYLKEKMRAVTK